LPLVDPPATAGGTDFDPSRIHYSYESCEHFVGQQSAGASQSDQITVKLEQTRFVKAIDIFAVLVAEINSE
jgi:hypothetical protein